MAPRNQNVKVGNYRGDVTMDAAAKEVLGPRGLGKVSKQEMDYFKGAKNKRTAIRAIYRARSANSGS